MLERLCLNPHLPLTPGDGTMRTIRGFTLVEVAIVMVIVGLLLGGLVSGFGTLQQQQKVSETNTRLADVREALLGFASANGRLPCPATSTSNGSEVFCTNALGACGATTTTPQGHGRCSNPYNGFLPAATLNLSGSSGGYLLDERRGDANNRIRYAVSDATPSTTPCSADAGTRLATSSTNLFQGKDVKVASCDHDGNGATPDVTFWEVNANTLQGLRICEDAACSIVHASNAVAVLVAPGPNGVGTGANEAENYNNDRLFVSRPPAETGATGGEFDDIVTWIAPTTLLSRLYQAGRLP